MRTGVVSADGAIEAIRTHGEQAVTVLSQQVEVAKQEGRQRVTKSVVRGQTVPRKIVAAVFSRVERAMEKMSAELRRQAEELQALPERDRANMKVEVEANVLIGLLQAAQEIEAMKTKRQEGSPKRGGRLVACWPVSLPRHRPKDQKFLRRFFQKAATSFDQAHCGDRLHQTNKETHHKGGPHESARLSWPRP